MQRTVKIKPSHVPHNDHRPTLRSLAALPLLLAALLLAACSSIDCPLNNRVMATYKWAGDVTTLSQDTLTVSTLRSQSEGDDTVLVNRTIGVDSINLPMSYSRAEDEFFFTFTPVADSTSARTAATDTVWVAKTDEAHFEAVDCSPAVFHTITGVRHTRHAIDSIRINNNQVTYNDAKAHILVYLKADRD